MQNSVSTKLKTLQMLPIFPPLAYPQSSEMIHMFNELLIRVFTEMGKGLPLIFGKPTLMKVVSSLGGRALLHL